jgi:dephospho-CoA kinase
MYKVGITGGIGAGKSTVCDLLRERGVAVYDSDSRAKQLMSEDVMLRAELIEAFGDAVYGASGLDRAYLAKSVFGNDEALRKLNAIVHPAVMRDFAGWAEVQEGDYVVLESAILFEAGLADRVDSVVAVMAPESLRLERAMARDGASRDEILRRIRSQMSDDERMERAKYAVVNIDREELAEDVEQLHRRLCYDSKANRH